MSDLKERVINVLTNMLINVVMFGLPIALVVMFGENFSLWINLLTLGCVLFVSAVLSMVGDEYESPKRILLALIGASIAASLKVLAYPGHTTAVILSTVLIIGTYDLINRGQIIWLEFARSARLRFLGKFIFLTTILFLISLIVANFGNQTIWIPIVAASLIILLLSVKNNYLYDEEIGARLLFAPALFILSGVISTIIQFWSVELFWGIKLWQLLIGMLIVMIIIAFLVVRRCRNKQREKQEGIKRMEEIRLKKEIEKGLSEKAKEKEKVDMFNALMEKDPNTITIRDLATIYNFDKNAAIQRFLDSEIMPAHISSLLTVSIHKKQIVWQADMTIMLEILELIASKSFFDEELGLVIKITQTIREKIINSKMPGEKNPYKGESELINMLTKIEKAASTNN